MHLVSNLKARKVTIAAVLFVYEAIGRGPEAISFIPDLPNRVG